MTPEGAIIHATKELIEALKGNVPGSLGDKSLNDLEKVEQIFSQKAQSYKAMSKVVEQPPIVRKEDSTPPRVETPTASEVRPIKIQPNEEDDNDESMERPRYSTQEDEADTPALNTKSQRITLTQEVRDTCD